MELSVRDEFGSARKDHWVLGTEDWRDDYLHYDYLDMHIHLARAG